LSFWHRAACSGATLLVSARLCPKRLRLDRATSSQGFLPAHAPPFAAPARAGPGRLWRQTPSSRDARCCHPTPRHNDRGVGDGFERWLGGGTRRGPGRYGLRTLRLGTSVTGGSTERHEWWQLSGAAASIWPARAGSVNRRSACPFWPGRESVL
jgi:hypothetical protein